MRPLAFLGATPSARWPAALSLLARLPTGAVGLVLPLMAIESGLGVTVGGGAMACCRVSHALAGPTWGRLVDRRGINAVVLAGAIGFSASAACLALVGPAAVGFLLMSLILGAFIIPMPAIMRSIWNRTFESGERRDAANAFESAMSEVVLIGARVLIAVMALVLPIPAVVAILAALTLGSSVALIFTGLVREQQPRGPTTRAPAFEMLWSGRSVFGVFFLLSAALGAFSICLIELAEAPTLASLSLAAWGLGSIVGIQVGHGDRFARRRHGLPILLAAIGVVAMCTSAAAGHAPLLLATAFVAGLPIAACVTEIYRILPAYAPPGADTEFLAWAVTVLLVGDAAGALVAGVTATYATMGPALAAALFAVCATAAASAGPLRARTGLSA